MRSPWPAYCQYYCFKPEYIYDNFNLNMLEETTAIFWKKMEIVLLCILFRISIYCSLLLLETEERLYKVSVTTGIALESDVSRLDSEIFLL